MNAGILNVNCNYSNTFTHLTPFDKRFCHLHWHNFEIKSSPNHIQHDISLHLWRLESSFPCAPTVQVHLKENITNVKIFASSSSQSSVQIHLDATKMIGSILGPQAIWENIINDNLGKASLLPSLSLDVSSYQQRKAMQRSRSEQQQRKPSHNVKLIQD